MLTAFVFLPKQRVIKVKNYFYKQKVLTLHSFYDQKQYRENYCENRQKSDTFFKLIFDFKAFEKTACPYRFFNKLS